MKIIDLRKMSTFLKQQLLAGFARTSSVKKQVEPKSTRKKTAAKNAVKPVAMFNERLNSNFQISPIDKLLTVEKLPKTTKKQSLYREKFSERFYQISSSLMVFGSSVINLNNSIQGVNQTEILDYSSSPRAGEATRPNFKFSSNSKSSTVNFGTPWLF